MREINHAALGLAIHLCQCGPLLGGTGGAGGSLATPVGTVDSLTLGSP